PALGEQPTSSTPPRPHCAAWNAIGPSPARTWTSRSPTQPTRTSLTAPSGTRRRASAGPTPAILACSRPARCSRAAPPHDRIAGRADTHIAAASGRTVGAAIVRRLDGRLAHPIPALRAVGRTDLHAALAADAVAAYRAVVETGRRVFARRAPQVP